MDPKELSFRHLWSAPCKFYFSNCCSLYVSVLEVARLCRSVDTSENRGNERARAASPPDFLVQFPHLPRGKPTVSDKLFFFVWVHIAWLCSSFQKFSIWLSGYEGLALFFCQRNYKLALLNTNSKGFLASPPDWLISPIFQVFFLQSVWLIWYSCEYSLFYVTGAWTPHKW